MEITEVIQLIDSLGTIGILVLAWYFERKRANTAIEEIITDWKRQNDRETLESQNP